MQFKAVIANRYYMEVGMGFSGVFDREKDALVWITKRFDAAISKIHREELAGHVKRSVLEFANEVATQGRVFQSQEEVDEMFNALPGELIRQPLCLAQYFVSMVIYHKEQARV